MTFSDAIIGRLRENNSWWRSTCSSMKLTFSSMERPWKAAGALNRFGTGLGAHRPGWRDEARVPIPAADAAVVPVLPRETGDREVEDARLVVVPGVDVHGDLAVRVLHRVVEHPLPEVLDRAAIVVLVRDVSPDHRGGDRDSDLVVVPDGHDLDVLTDLFQVLLQRTVDELLRLQG